MKLVKCVLVVALALATAAAASAADDWTGDEALFLASNPNNGWEYGFLDGNGVFIPYNTTFKATEGIVGWALDRAPGPCGDVTMNCTSQSIDRFGLHWEPGQVCINASQEGQGTVVRWRSANSANIRIDARMVGQTRGARVGVKVVADGVQIVNDAVGEPEVVEGGASPALTEAPSLTKSLTTQVSRNGTVDLIIAPGDDDSPRHLGLDIVISLVGPDGSVISKTSPSTPRETDKQAQAPATAEGRS